MVLVHHDCKMLHPERIHIRMALQPTWENPPTRKNHAIEAWVRMMEGDGDGPPSGGAAGSVHRGGYPGGGEDLPRGAAVVCRDWAQAGRGTKPTSVCSISCADTPLSGFPLLFWIPTHCPTLDLQVAAQPFLGRREGKPLIFGIIILRNDKKLFCSEAEAP